MLQYYYNKKGGVHMVPKFFRWFVYKYEDGRFHVDTMHQSQNAANICAGNVIDNICEAHGYKRKFNDTGEVQAYIAADGDKIVAARLVKRVF